MQEVGQRECRGRDAVEQPGDRRGDAGSGPYHRRVHSHAGEDRAGRPWRPVGPGGRTSS